MAFFDRWDRKAEKPTRTHGTRAADCPYSGERVETELFGLFELWPDTPPGEDPSKVPTVLDIVAVHGLGGHPYKTWTEVSRRKRVLRSLISYTAIII